MIKKSGQKKIYFDKFWNANFKNVVPVSFIFRELFRERWIRIHSLPGGQRYPSNDKELNAIIAHQNKLISSVLQKNTCLYVLISSYNSTQGFPTGYEFDAHLNDFMLLDSINLDKVLPSEFEKGLWLRLAVKWIKWRSNIIDEFLKRVINDEVDNFFLISGKRTLICPYDGGVDIICPDLRTKYKLASKYSIYLPAEFKKLSINE